RRREKTLPGGAEPDLVHVEVLRLAHGETDGPRYCSSLTCSIQSTSLPSSCSWMAMCVIAVVADAPCQCFSPGANQITSPGRIASMGPPQRCARPAPAVTRRVWPNGCVCHAVRAPGSN